LGKSKGLFLAGLAYIDSSFQGRTGKTLEQLDLKFGLVYKLSTNISE
jgi:hypothetical protein